MNYKEFIKKYDYTYWEDAEEDFNKINEGNVFINHVEGHLKDDEKVICKICGRTAKQIIERAKRNGLM